MSTWLAHTSYHHTGVHVFDTQHAHMCVQVHHFRSSPSSGTHHQTGRPHLTGIQAQNGGIKIIAPLRVARRRLVDIKATLEAMPAVPGPSAVYPSVELGEVLVQVRTASM